jgi:glutamine amidotransferase
MLGIIDYDMGNLGSVTNAFRFLKLDARVVRQPEDLDDCSAVVLPGVGAFGDCMRELTGRGLAERLRDWVGEGKPYLGMCLGLQVLFEGSEESPGVEGLGLLKGTVKRFKLPSEFKVPQIGWNAVEQVKRDCPLFEGIDDRAYFYFVHSYYVDPASDAVVAGLTDFGMSYTSVVWQGNLMAVQFHPEKSQQDGLRMVRNFAAHVAGLESKV